MEAQEFVENTVNNKGSNNNASQLAKDIFLPSDGQNELRCDLDTGINLLQKFKKDLIDILGKDFESENDLEQKAIRANNDIANFIDHKVTDNELKLHIINSIYVPPENYKFPITTFKSGQKRILFKFRWLTKWRWLAYSPSKDGVFCKYCVLFHDKRPPKLKIEKLITKPYTNWKKVYENFNNHEKIEYHRLAEKEIFTLCPALAVQKGVDDAAKAATTLSTSSASQLSNSCHTNSNFKCANNGIKIFAKAIANNTNTAVRQEIKEEFTNHSSFSVPPPPPSSSSIILPNDICHFVNKASLIVQDPVYKVQAFHSIFTPPIDYMFPRDGGVKKRPRFQYLWFTRWLWLAYSQAENGAYCKYCVFCAPPPCPPNKNLTLASLKTKKPLAPSSFSNNNKNSYKIDSLRTSLLQNQGGAGGLSGPKPPYVSLGAINCSEYSSSNPLMASTVSSSLQQQNASSDHKKYPFPLATTSSAGLKKCPKPVYLSLVHKPFRNWKKAIEQYTNHEASDAHKLAICTFLSLKPLATPPPHPVVADSIKTLEHKSEVKRVLLLQERNDMGQDQNEPIENHGSSNNYTHFINPAEFSSNQLLQQQQQQQHHNHIIQALLRSQNIHHHHFPPVPHSAINQVFENDSAISSSPSKSLVNTSFEQSADNFDKYNKYNEVDHDRQSPQDSSCSMGLNLKRRLNDTPLGEREGGQDNNRMIVKTEFTVASCVGMEQINNYLGNASGFLFGATRNFISTQHHNHQQPYTNHHLVPPALYHNPHQLQDQQLMLHYSSDNCEPPPSKVCKQEHHHTHYPFNQTNQGRGGEMFTSSSSVQDVSRHYHHADTQASQQQQEQLIQQQLIQQHNHMQPSPRPFTSHHHSLMSSSTSNQLKSHSSTNLHINASSLSNQHPPPPTAAAPMSVNSSFLSNNHQITTSANLNSNSQFNSESKSVSSTNNNHISTTNPTNCNSLTAAPAPKLSNIPLPFIQAAAAIAVASSNNSNNTSNTNPNNNDNNHIFENLRSINEFINL